MEIYTLHAAHGSALVGPYSRFGWNHPGPALFYWFLPFYTLAGGKAAGLTLGALALNFVAVTGSVWLALRLGGAWQAGLLVVLLACHLAALRPARAASVWNPYVTVLPFVLFLFLCAALALRGSRVLPSLAGLGSFLVQTHVGYLPPVAALVLTAWLLRRRGREPGSAAPHAGRGLAHPLAASGLVLAILWAPPALEQLRQTPGNLTKLRAFFETAHVSHEFWEVFGPVARQLSAVPLAFARIVVPSTSDQRDLGSGFLALGLIAALPVACVLTWRRRDAYASTLAALATVGLAVSLAAVYRIVGPVLDYLVIWTSGIGLVGWVALVSALPRMTRPSRRALRPAAAGAAAAFVALAAVANVRQMRGEPPLASLGNPLLEHLAGALERDAAMHGKPLVRIASHDSWVPAAGILLQLYRRGVPFAVEPAWVFMFGAPLAPDGREARTLLLGDRGLETELATRPDHSRVAAEGDVVIYAFDDPGYVERHLYKGTLRAVATERTHGDPALAGDGVFPPEGTIWNDRRCLLLDGAGSSVTLALPVATARGVLVSADHNDRYDVLASEDGVTFLDIGQIPPRGEAGMRTRALFSSRLAGCRYVRVTAVSGDGSYSVGEVGILNQKAEPF